VGRCWATPRHIWRKSTPWTRVVPSSRRIPGCGLLRPLLPEALRFYGESPAAQ